MRGILALADDRKIQSVISGGSHVPSLIALAHDQKFQSVISGGKHVPIPHCSLSYRLRVPT